MLKLKLQYFGQLMQRTDSFEKTLMLGKIEGRRRREKAVVASSKVTISQKIMVSKALVNSSNDCPDTQETT